MAGELRTAVAVRRLFGHARAPFLAARARARRCANSRLQHRRAEIARCAIPRTSATSSGVPVATTSPPAVAGFRAEIDHPVGAFDDFEIVLDDEQRIPLLDQPVEDAHEQRHVVEMQPGRRLVENEQRLFLALGRPALDELEPLRFAAAEHIQRLARA